MFPLIYNCHLIGNKGTNGYNVKNVQNGRNSNNRVRGNNKYTRFNGRYINNKYLKNNGVTARSVNKGAPMSCDN